MHVCVCARVCVRVCVHPQGHKYVTSGVILALYDRLNNCSCFSVAFYDSCCIGVALLTKCVTSYSQKKTKIRLY